MADRAPTLKARAVAPPRQRTWIACGYCMGRGTLGSMLMPLSYRDCPACHGSGEVVAGMPW